VATDDKKADTTQASDNAAEPTSSAPTIENTAIMVDAKQYFKDYQDNEVTADEKYKGKDILISGVVASIQKDFTDGAYITLSVDEIGIQNVRVTLKDNNDAKTLHKGQAVRFSGIGGGMIMGDPLIDDGVLK
jgi:hypothetical protein